MNYRVWYNKTGDETPTIITDTSSSRPDEKFFVANISDPDSRKYRINWVGNSPSLVTDSSWNDKVKLDKLYKDLAIVDNEVKEADKLPFTFGSNTFYPDTEFIQGMFSVLPYLPSNYTERWKTADKEEDGVNNIYVTLDKAGIQGLALAYLQFKKTNWSVGESKKQVLKDAFKNGN